MYEYLNGVVVDINPAYIVIDVNGVGYLVNVANPYSFKPDEKQKVYVHQAVSETENTLYGFKKYVDKELFLNLLKVKGIGPKSALAILANDDHQGFIRAVNNDDVNYLKKFPKIGPKAAKQIILDLKGKITSNEPSGPLFEMPTTTNNTLDEAIEALAALGYSERELKKITPKLDELSNQTTDQYISAGLKLLMKG
ncbi:Holliday junction branch migration protein RuvA [Pediococcus acidilactici]|uniref:Holliday junction branch migration complex subunit RuvA n=1 Tax=Pediococcus acidilactici DSM 20284 TaxID=862514 RepID=E0NFV7_PEDAC|nr:Holliday junction branch migration protein RuvA [Pediococcus acidilactici]AZP91013.1 Holliday junction branch migration protein RuvA [Pediococcus acidilactici]EFA26208.1 Holliday junction DNA helicase RuvA [Pediococcus acidilactici 7_4]EFL95676.1 Holliday junction DNA helicase RuvA [Pediococcus acidilactici DSM 20284]KAF0370675.1 Holliday junction branch migration protein RuvA [Pediococcus acidilactici]KAF0389473.1 Holliday junction branch migration protein RuvA [Pediococcus acidilactici]